MRKLALLLVALLLLGATFSASAAASTPTADPNCSGSLIPQLTPGSPGHVASFFSSLRNTPNGTVKQVIFSPATFSVQTAAQTTTDTGLSQPTCQNNVWFWYIQYTDVDGSPFGWASESQVVSIFGLNQYWLLPGEITPPTTPTSCSSDTPFGLEQGGKGEIALSFSTLRTVPAGTGERISAPATFTVYASGNVPAGYTQPTCVAGQAYWYIQYDDSGKFGWANEGFGGTYYLIPVS
jgi:hypothetical protein